MIRNYLYTVGRYLPASQRDDILKDIEANIYDYLEKSYGEKEYTNEEIEKILYEMGNPKKVAQSYLDKPRHLIGPQYVDIYLLVVKIAFLGISIGMLVVSVIKLVFEGDLLDSLLSFAAGVWNAGLVMVGMVTIIFALVERYGETDSSSFDESNPVWTIESLESPPEDAAKIKVSDLVIESIFIIVLLAILNQGPINLGIYSNYALVLMNYEVIEPYIFWINLVLGLNLILNLYLFIKRNWSIATRLFAMTLDIAGIGIFAVLVLTPNLWDFSSITGITEEAVKGIELGVNLGMKIGLAAIVVITLIEVFKHFRAIFRKK